MAESERILLQEELPRLEAERSSLSKTFDELNSAAAEGAEEIVSRLTLTKNERRKAEVRTAAFRTYLLTDLLLIREMALCL